MKQVVGIMAALVIALVPVSFASAVAERTQPERPDVTERVTTAREEAKVRSTEAKEAAQMRKLALTQERCEKAQDRLAKIVPKLSQGVTSVKKTLDKNYERIQAVYGSGKLSVANYDELSANVETAKAEAETSMELIDPSSVTVDCENAKLGTELDSYRSTVKETRTSLKAYHAALVELVSSMNASESTDEGATDATETDKDTEAGTETPTEDTNTQEGLENAN